MARVLDSVRRGPEVVVLSEENWLGEPQSVLAGQVYPKASRKVRMLHQIAGKDCLTLFLGIRSLDTVCGSIYCQLLRYGPLPGGFEQFRETILTRRPRWTDLLLRIRSAAQGREIYVWRYEDYAQHGPQILRFLCGRNIGNFRALQRPLSTSSPSADAVAEVEALDENLPPSVWKARVGAIFAERQLDATTPRFAPFSQAESAYLRVAYERDLADITRIDNVTLLRFTTS